MGFFKKLIRKVTKPISKVLDKVVPNEVKPFLPYAAAFMPMFAPGMFAAGAGGIGSLTGISNPLIRRAIMGGGLNALGQLSQEGNDGNLNLVSTGLGALSGAMSGPRSDFTSTTGNSSNVLQGPGGADAARFGRITDGGIMGAAKTKGMNFLNEGNKIFNAGTGSGFGFNMDTLKAAALPGAIATGDVAAAESNLAMKDYEIALRDYENNIAEGDAATNAGRREAILAAMTGNHTQEVIDQTLADLGLRDGGRVAYNMGGRVARAYGGGFGGIESAVQNVKDRDLKENLTIAKDVNMDMKELAQDFLSTYKRQPNSYDELMEFYKKRNGYNAGSEEVVEEQVMTAANGGIMNARVPFVSGGMARGLINAAKFADDAPLMLRSADEVPAGLVDEMGEPLKYSPAKNIDEVVDITKVTEEVPRGPVGPGMLDVKAAGNPQAIAAAEFIQDIRGVDGGIDYVIAQEKIGRGVELKGTETIEELIELFLYTGPNKKAIAAIGAGYAGLGGMAGADMAAKGGIMGYNSGGSVLPNGVEMDYRGGGFIPMGSKERADDVPARVSKNEFVMTADAVRAAGGGSVNQGAKKMYELMNNLEAKA